MYFIKIPCYTYTTMMPYILPWVHSFHKDSIYSIYFTGIPCIPQGFHDSTGIPCFPQGFRIFHRDSIYSTGFHTHYISIEIQCILMGFHIMLLYNPTHLLFVYPFYFTYIFFPINNLLSWNRIIKHEKSLPLIDHICFHLLSTSPLTLRSQICLVKLVIS